MRLLIDINNTIGPWLSEISLVAWAVVTLSCCFVWSVYRSQDFLVIAGYISGLEALAWSETFTNLNDLMLAHLFMWTMLVICKYVSNCVHSRLGATFMVVAFLMPFLGAMSKVWEYPVQYYIWGLFLLFLTLCSLALYGCLKSPDNKGRFGERQDVDLLYFLLYFKARIKKGGQV